MSNIMLEELVRIIPGDIEKGLIKGTKRVRDIPFTNISQLSAQYRKDRVLCFDIISNQNGKRVLVVKLANWGLLE